MLNFYKYILVLLVNEDKVPRDIVLHGWNEQLRRVSEFNKSYDALQYPLMYTHGRSMNGVVGAVAPSF
jgi:hypothetical protein